MTFKQFFTFKHNKFFWLNIAGMIVAVVVVVALAIHGLDVYTHHGQAVVIPDVKGMDVEEAARLFESRGLKYIVADSTYVKTMPGGCILDYKPEAGRKVKEGRMVYLTVNNRCEPLYSIPDVADNSSLRQAEARLLSAGFRLEDPELIPGEKGWVYGVKYRDSLLDEHSRVPMGALLTIVVGSGEDDFPTDSLSVEEIDSLRRERMKLILGGEDSWF